LDFDLGKGQKEIQRGVREFVKDQFKWSQAHRRRLTILKQHFGRLGDRHSQNDVDINNIIWYLGKTSYRSPKPQI
jgi:hypothetical protein